MKNKIKVSMERQEITDEELERFKDFDSLLKRHQQIQVGKTPWKIIMPAVILTSLVVYLAWREFYEPASPTRVQEQTTQVAKSTPEVTLDQPTTTATESKQPDVAEKKDAKKNEKSIVPKLDKPQISSSDTASLSSAVQPNSIKTKTESVYLQAEPVNGYPALYEYFSRELIYPKEAVKDSVQGVLTVTFLINTAGKPEQIKTSGSLGQAFDREAVRLVENMPPWKSATLNGQPVASKLSIPLTFELRNKK